MTSSVRGGFLRDDTTGALVISGSGGWPDFSTTHAVPLSLHGPPSQAIAHGGLEMRAVRAVAPKAGTLNGFHLANTGLGGAVTHAGAIYAVNKTTLARTKLWDSGWSSPAVANNWYSLGNPNLSVAAYDWLDFALAVSAASGPTFLRSNSWVIGPRLPNSGDYPSWKVTAGVTAGSALPASLALTDLGTGTPAPFIVCSYA